MLLEAIKLLKNKNVVQELGEFHNHLLMYLVNLEDRSKKELLEPAEAEFLARSSKYLTFLHGLGVRFDADEPAK